MGGVGGDCGGQEIAWPKGGRAGVIEALDKGALAFESTRFVVYEDIAIYPDKSATVFHSDFFDGQAHDTIWDLRYEGVYRRPSGFLLRRLVECDPEDIQSGDRLILARKNAEPLQPKVSKQRDRDYYNREVYGHWL